MRKAHLLIGLVVTCAAIGGYALGWITCSRTDRGLLATQALTHELVITHFAASALLTLQEGHPDRLEKLLWHRVSSGVDQLERQRASGTRLSRLPESSSQSLLSSLDRVQRAASGAGQSELVTRIESLRAGLSSE